jgi:hypothetical protein
VYKERNYEKLVYPFDPGFEQVQQNLISKAERLSTNHSYSCFGRLWVLDAQVIGTTDKDYG